MQSEESNQQAYAIIRSGGKQYSVKPGSIIKVEKLEGQDGSEIAFTEVLLSRDASGKVSIGAPFVAGASVTGKILGTAKERKRVIFKKRRRQGYKLRRGHRQSLTSVQIQSI